MIEMANHEMAYSQSLSRNRQFLICNGRFTESYYLEQDGGRQVLIAGVVLMILSVAGSIITGGVGFTWLLFFLLGYSLTVACILWNAQSDKNRSLWKKTGFFIIGWIGFVSVGTFMIIQGLIMTAGRWTGNISASDIIVPGAGIIRKEPSFTLAGRLDTAADYMHLHPESRAILTGGLADGQLASEAQVMAWYLEDRGIESSRIILEEQSSNTLENITHSMTLIKQAENRDLSEVLIITSDYHLLRTQMIARRAGLKAAGIRSLSPPDLYKQYAVREFFAIFKSMFLDGPQ
jgi:uncharacterized SAM-binding protein YcdF (DUF218 family)